MCLTGEDDTDELATTDLGCCCWPLCPELLLLEVVEVVEVEEEEVGFQATLSTFSLNSYRMQMEPFSPMRYDTSRGSIHMVSSDGKVW